MDYFKYGPEIKTAQQLSTALEEVDATEDVKEVLEDQKPRIIVHKWHRIPLINDCYQLLTQSADRHKDDNIPLYHLSHLVLKERFKSSMVATFKYNLGSFEGYTQEIMGTRIFQAQTVLQNLIKGMVRSTLPTKYNTYFNDYVLFWDMPGIYCENTFAGLNGHCQFKEFDGLTRDDFFSFLVFDVLTKSQLVKDTVDSDRFLSQSELLELSKKRYKNGQNPSFFVSIPLKGKLYRQFFGLKEHVDFVMQTKNEVIKKYQKQQGNNGNES